jgi:hypothetical protein
MVSPPKVEDVVRRNRHQKRLAAVLLERWLALSIGASWEVRLALIREVRSLEAEGLKKAP